jgi:hypothetical protein
MSPVIGGLFISLHFVLNSTYEMHLKTYLVDTFLLLQFLLLPEIVILDSKQSCALPWLWGEWVMEPW